MKEKIPKGELVFLGVILLYVVYYFLTTKEYAIKATLWPRCLMAAAVLAVINVGLELLRKSSAKEATETIQQAEKQETESLVGWIKEKMPIFVVIISFVIYTILLKTLGLHICNFLLVFAMVLYLNKGNWKTALATAGVMTFCFYLVFDFMLGMRLPRFKLF